jgi:undecaprenyl-diphosphatase
LAYRKKWQAFTQVAFGIAGAALLNLILKTLFERDRPHLWQWIVHESSYSFPSGHATMTAALAFTLMLLAWRTKYRYVAVVGGICYMILIGLTRMYLGVHYPTDILAGWCVSLAWVLIVATVLGAVRWQPFLEKFSRTR